VFPRDMVCLRTISIDTLHKGDTEDNNNNNNNNINKTYINLYLECCSLWIENMDLRKNKERVVNAFET
jgi:hypothetical protein